MEIKNMTTAKLKAEIDKCKNNIACYEEALRHLPIESVLGRWGVNASIRREEKRLYKLNKELELRVDKCGFRL